MHNSNAPANTHKTANNNNIIAEAKIFDNDKIDENDFNGIEVKSIETSKSIANSQINTPSRRPNVPEP